MTYTLIQEAFLKQYRLSPSSTAIICEDKSWSFEHVERESRHIAFELQKRGLTRGSRISILAERGPALVWTVLGVLRAGAAFIIMDINYPIRRLEDFIKTSRPHLIIPAGGEIVKEIVGILSDKESVPALALQQNATFSDEIAGFSDATHCNPFTDIAYMIFTSGSTGTPKGIGCNHAALVHFINWHASNFDLRSSDRFSMLSGLTHDPILRDIFTPLSIGATLVIPRQCDITEPGRLRLWLQEAGITIAHLTPPMGQLLLAGDRQNSSLPALRKMFWGGDQLLARLLESISRLAPNVEHVNFYGSSETPQAVAFYRFINSQDREIVPIGAGVPGFKVMILGSDKQPISCHEIGEIAVQSRFLSLGYIHDGILTEPQERGFDSDSGETIYYTGDQGRYLEDGNIVMVGRIDDQIKIRGFRVDLSEVTAALQTLPGVQMAVALPIRDGELLSIEAFIATNGLTHTDSDTLLSNLSMMLPSYMLPRRLWFFETKLPILANGKIDRAALQSHARNSARIESNVSLGGADSEIELLRSRWRSIFPGQVVSSQSTFSELGGDSLSYVEAYIVAEEVVGQLPINWQEKSIEELSAKSIHKSRWFRSLDSFMLVRAIAIVLVVAYHFGLSKLGDGETGALFLISGYLFGSMQLRESFSGGSANRILISVKNIILPTALFTLVATLASYWSGHAPPLSLFLFSTDLVNYPVLLARHEPIFRHIVIFWYVHALIQILMMLYLFILFLPKRFRTLGFLLPIMVILFFVGTFAKFGLPMMFESGFLSHGAPELSLEQISPIGNFSTFMLGVVLANVSNNFQKLASIAVAFMYVILDGPTYGWLNAVPLFVGAFLLLYVPRIQLPRVFSNIILSLSSASLFIYLGHVYIGDVSAKVFKAPAVLQCLLALLSGVGLHWLWDRRSQFLKSARNFALQGVIPPEFRGIDK